MSRLNKLYETYEGRVTFFVVYIREAHAADGRRPDRELEVYEPKTFEERLGVASTCRKDLGLKLPLLVDDLKNSTDASYSGWPDRLFLVGTDGKIAYRGGRGPRGFKPEELEAAIKAVVGPKAERTPEELEAIRERLRQRRRESGGD